MSNADPNPDNPVCPICGASDWYGEPTIELGLIVMDAGNAGKVWKDAKGDPEVMPVEVAICRRCRFVRLRSARGGLTIRDLPLA